MSYTYNPFINNFDDTGASGTGDVSGPGISVIDDSIVRWDGTSGTLIKGSLGILDDSGNLTVNSIILTVNLPVADGGTGASTAAGARTNLGLVIGTDVQAWDAQLDSVAAVGDGIVVHTGVDTFTPRSIVGSASILVTNGDGVSGNPTISHNVSFEETAMHSWNGSLLETADVDVTSNGSTITCSVQLEGGGDLTAVFSDGFYDWDTSPADTVTLTVGTDTSPQLNFVYFLQSTKTLTASTVNFPITEHAPIATVVCQSAASLQTDGAYKVHVWTDHVTNSNDQGHISDINHWIREQNATWDSGVSQTYTITTNGGAADNVILTTSLGEVLQLHHHDFPAFSGTPDIYVVNDSATPYTKVTDLNALLTDSDGVSMSGKYFSLVIWGVVSEDTTDCKLFCNLPSGSYNNASSVGVDANKYANFTIPGDYTGTGFLISRWDLRHQAVSSGTWSSINETDLRGQIPQISVGGSNVFPNEFEDNVFRILDESDNTKEIAFQASGITTITTRTITMADQDVDLTPTTGTYQGSDAGLTDIAGLAVTDGNFIVGDNSNWVAESGATARTSLGLGTIATQASNSVSISGGTITGITDLVVADGGTGASTLGDGFILLGSGTDPITALDVTAKGSIIAGDGTTDPVALAVGTNDFVLTADSGEASGLKWAAAGGGGAWTLISSQTASASATIEFTGLSTDFMYTIFIQGIVPATDGEDLYMRTSTDGGSTFDSGASNYSYSSVYQAFDLTTVSVSKNQGDTEIWLNASSGPLGSAANELGSWKIDIFNPSDTNYTQILWRGTWYDDNGDEYQSMGAGYRLSAADVDAIQFIMSSGNIASGVFKLYGLTAS